MSHSIAAGLTPGQNGGHFQRLVYPSIPAVAKFVVSEHCEHHRKPPAPPAKAANDENDSRKKTTNIEELNQGHEQACPE